MRLVVGNRRCYLLEGVETIWLLSHESLNFRLALGLNLGSQINHNQRTSRHVTFAHRDKACTSTHRGADQHWFIRTQCRDDTTQILDHHVRAIATLSRPVGITMASGVKGDSIIARSPKGLAGPLPRIVVSASKLQVCMSVGPHSEPGDLGTGLAELGRR